MLSNQLFIPGIGFVKAFSKVGSFGNTNMSECDPGGSSGTTSRRRAFPGVPAGGTEFRRCFVCSQEISEILSFSYIRKETTINMILVTKCGIGFNGKAAIFF